MLYTLIIFINFVLIKCLVIFIPHLRMADIECSPGLPNIILSFRVTCSETYFVEELLYADEESLENCKDLELIVFTLKPGLVKINENINFDESVSQATVSKNPKELDTKDDDSKIACNFMDQESCKFSANLPGIMSGSSLLLDIISQENKFILDIDMDFFSTQNPFKLLYTEVRKM